MLSVLLALAGCVWISDSAHQDRLKEDAQRETLDLQVPERVLVSCESIEFGLVSSSPVPEGVEVELMVAGLPLIVETEEGTDSQNAILRPDFGDLFQRCGNNCTVTATVSLDGEVVTSDASNLELLREAEVSLYAPNGDLVLPGEDLLRVDALRVEVTNLEAFGGTVEVCPDDFTLTEDRACVSADIGVDGTVSAAEISACPLVRPLEEDLWRATITIAPDRCDGGTLPVAEFGRLRVLIDDCDGDEFLVPEDCDDIDPTVNPDRPLFVDSDLDGYGGVNPSDVCAPREDWPADVVDIDGDCEDDDASINPESDDEDCDGVDNDCNGIADDMGPLLVEWGPDGDGDGFGQALLDSQSRCGNYISGPSDCNDDNADVFPGQVENWENGLDDDCDGVIRCDSFECSGVEHQVSSGLFDFPSVGTPGVATGPTGFRALYPTGDPEVVGLSLSEADSLLVAHVDGDGFPDIVWTEGPNLRIRAGLAPYDIDSYVLDNPIQHVVSGYFDGEWGENQPVDFNSADLLVFLQGNTQSLFRNGADLPEVVSPAMAVGQVRAALTWQHPECYDEIFVASNSGFRRIVPNLQVTPRTLDGNGVSLLRGGSFDSLAASQTHIAAWGESGLMVWATDPQPEEPELRVVSQSPIQAAAFPEDGQLMFSDGTVLHVVDLLTGDSFPGPVLPDITPTRRISALAFGEVDGLPGADLVIGDLNHGLGNYIVSDWAGTETLYPVFGITGPEWIAFADANEDGILDAILQDAGTGVGFANPDPRTLSFAWDSMEFQPGVLQFQHNIPMVVYGGAHPTPNAPLRTQTCRPPSSF